MDDSVPILVLMKIVISVAVLGFADSEFRNLRVSPKNKLNTMGKRKGSM